MDKEKEEYIIPYYKKRHYIIYYNINHINVKIITHYNIKIINATVLFPYINAHHGPRIAAFFSPSSSF